MLPPMWPVLTHQGPELFHPIQNELLVAYRPHCQSLQASGAQLEQVLARQLPVLKGIVLQGIVQAWRDRRGQCECVCGCHGFSSHIFILAEPFSLPLWVEDHTE